jgi:hypothetical protein
MIKATIQEMADRTDPYRQLERMMTLNTATTVTYSLWISNAD